MNHYPHHIGDFDKATRHLTRLERSIYRDMIELYYDREAMLPLDSPWICRKILARSNEEVTAVEQALNEFFEQTPEGWYHERCEAEIEKFRANSSQKAQAGKASAAARAAAKQRAINGRSTDVGTDDETDVKQPSNGTPTNQNQNQNQNQEPRTKNTGDGAKPELFGFDAFWSAYDKKVERPAAEKSWKRLSPDAELLQRIIAAVAVYVASTPDKTYRKNPSTWLNNKCWDDEVIVRGALPQTSQGLNKQEALEQSNAGVADRFIQKLEAQGAFN